MTVQNLDVACATLGVKLGSSGNKDTENSITKALKASTRCSCTWSRERTASSSLI